MKKTISLVSLLLSFVFLFSMTSVAFALDMSRDMPRNEVSKSQLVIDEFKAVADESLENTFDGLEIGDTNEGLAEESGEAEEGIEAVYSNILGFYQIIHYEVVLNKTSGKYEPTGKSSPSPVLINPAAISYRYPSPYNCFVSVVRTAEYGTFTNRYGVFIDDYNGSIKVTNPSYLGSTIVGGRTYTVYEYYSGYVVYSNEHALFEAVSRPQGWTGTGDGIAMWASMY